MTDFNTDLFQENWQGCLEESNPYTPLIRMFIEWVVQNEVSIAKRHDLAKKSTDQGILAMLAFDKSHKKFPGDIRYLVSKNPNTSEETLEMIANNEDREGWTWEDWLDYENDDWSDEVDFVAEYGNDLANEITEKCKSEALLQLASKR